MKKRKQGKLSFFLVLFIGFIYFTFLENFSFSIPCLFYKITGFYCPGCGASRMLYSLVRGELYQAFRFNPLLFLFFPWFVLGGVIHCYSSFVLKKNLLAKIPNFVWYFLAILFLAYGMMRNIPSFDYLRPTIIFFYHLL